MTHKAEFSHPDQYLALSEIPRVCKGLSTVMSDMKGGLQEARIFLAWQQGTKRNTAWHLSCTGISAAPVLVSESSS